MVQGEGEHRVPIKTNDIAVVVNAILAIARVMGTIDQSELLESCLNQ